MKQTILLLTLTVFGLTSWKHKQTTEIRNDFKKYYDQFNVDGSFVLYDPQDDKYILYNQNQFNQRFTPASTFKICNSLIGLETGVIKNENFIIPWDSIMRKYPKWNSDHDLKTAFKNSTVWYYQELARQVGVLRAYLEKQRISPIKVSLVRIPAILVAGILIRHSRRTVCRTVGGSLGLETHTSTLY